MLCLSCGLFIMFSDNKDDSRTSLKDRYMYVSYRMVVRACMQAALLFVVPRQPLLFMAPARFNCLICTFSFCAGVPRVFDRIYASAMAKIEEKGGLAAKLFKWGYSRKSARLKRNIPADRVNLMR